MANNTIEYTLRCPDCLRDISTFDILMTYHKWCPDVPEGDPQKPLVLVAIDGYDVSNEKDPKPALKAPLKKAKT